MALPHRYLICVLLGLCTLVSHAQTLPIAAEPSAQFRVVSMSDLATFYFDIGKKQEQLNACVGSFSPLYPAPQNREIIFYAEVPDPDPSKPPIKESLAETVLPPQSPGPFLILLNQNPPGSKLKFSTLVIDNSLKVYPADTFRVFNFSKRSLAVRLADKNLVLSTGQIQEVPYPSTRKAWLQVAAKEKDNGWLLVSSSPHPVGSNSRTSVFLVDIPSSPRDPNPQGIIARRIREVIFTDDKGVQHVQ